MATLFQARKREAKEQKNRQRQRRANSIGAFRSGNATEAGNGVAAAAAPAVSSDDLDAVLITMNTTDIGYNDSELVENKPEINNLLAE